MKKLFILLASLVVLVVSISTCFACMGATYEPKLRS
jgi:cyclic lactone autoinducer peptide